MDSPNRITNITSGTKLTIGIVSESPTSWRAQPHWKTATTMP